MKDKDDVILCVSGGIDSLVAYYYLGMPKTVFFDYGDYTKHEKKVVQALIPGCIIDTSLNLSGVSMGVKAGCDVGPERLSGLSR